MNLKLQKRKNQADIFFLVLHRHGLLTEQGQGLSVTNTQHGSVYKAAQAHVRLGFCHYKAYVVRFLTCHIYFKASCATAFLLISIVSNLLFHQLPPLILEVLYKQDTSAKQFLGHPVQNQAEDLLNIVILSSAIITALFNLKAGIQWKVKICFFFYCNVWNKTLPSDH